MAKGFRDPLAGIKSFAPEFWRLVAEPAPQSSEPAPVPMPEPTPDPPVELVPSRPPLTNDSLEALRDSIGRRADNLQDAPSPSLPPYPPFTGYGPPLTSDALRGLREAAPEWGELKDIPRPTLDSEKKTPLPPIPGVESAMSESIKKLETLRATIPRLEAEKSKPQRAGQGAAFDEEIAKTRNEIARVEAELGKAARYMPRYYPNV